MPYEDFSSLTNVSPALTNDFLTKSLSDWFNEQMTFTHWEYVSDTGKGDSYLSELIRIRIHGRNSENSKKHVQVVLKNIPKNLARRLTFKSDEFFKNEINFYNKVLPHLLKFQSEKKLKDPFVNYAKIFLTHCDGTNDVICLEDASVYGFDSAIRQEGIDFEHCKVALEALAKYHAISFAFKDQNPQSFKEISEAIIETYYDYRVHEWYKRFFDRICRIAIDAVEKEYPNTIYVEKIKQFAVPERYFDMVKAAKTYETGVISHGDCWTNNFLFKYNDKRPVDAKIIDFQLARCASPVLDVAFFIYACTTQCLRLKHYNDLLNLYYATLSKQIQEMGSDPKKIYSWDLFMDEIKKYSYFGLAFSFESMPFIILAPEDAVNMEVQGDEKVDIDDVWQIGFYKTKEGRLRSANNVVHCVDNGYI